MADVLDMVENALATKDATDEDTHEDFDAVPMPDFFAPVRRVVCDEKDGELRTWIKALRWYCRWPWPIVMVSLPMKLVGFDQYTLSIQEVTAKKVVNELSGAADISIMFMFTLFARQLQKAIKPGGTLEQMGAGTQACSARVVRNLTRLRNALAVAVVISVLGAVIFAILWVQFPLMAIGILEWPETIGNNGEKTTWGILLMFVFILPMFPATFGCFIPCTAGWYFSLKVAAALSNDDVVEVLRDINEESMQDDLTFAAKVAQPCVKLATDTMRHLSEWGHGVGLLAVGLWSFAIVRFGKFLAGAAVYEGHCVVGEFCAQSWHKAFLPAVACSIAPFLLAFECAGISSMCDALREKIVKMRLRWTSTAAAQEVYQRTVPLTTMLREMNHEQGLGFIVFGKVVDKKTLNLVLTAMASLLGTLLPLLAVLTSTAQAELENGSSVECALTDAQRAMVKAAFVGANTTCSYDNTTIGSVLLAT